MTVSLDNKAHRGIGDDLIMMDVHRLVALSDKINALISVLKMGITKGNGGSDFWTVRMCMTAYAVRV
jgi:hypothetical protein